jgi:hypothetical protein
MMIELHASFEAGHKRVVVRIMDVKMLISLHMDELFDHTDDDE